MNWMWWIEYDDELNDKNLIQLRIECGDNFTNF